MNCIGFNGVGTVYGEWDIPIGKFLLDYTAVISVGKYFYLQKHGDIDVWASANSIQECNPLPDMLECFTHRIKIVVDIVDGTDVNVANGICFLNKGVKIGKAMFWYSKCQKEIYRLEEINL